MATISILGVPLDLGAGRRGVDMGPSALRLARLESTLTRLGHTVDDLGNIEAPVAEALKDAGPLPYADTIATVCQRTFEALESLADSTFPVILGGDHSISMGSVAGVAKRENIKSQKRTGVLWIDAHTDVNTPQSSKSGNIHGMPLAHLLGHGDDRLLQAWGGGEILESQDIVFIGLRSVDEAERDFVRSHGIKALTMKDIDKRGIAHIAAEALDHLTACEQLHVSFDADALDPLVAPGVGTPVPGGLSYREAHLLMELLADSKKVSSLDLVEVNPILDTQNKTAKVMVEMAASLLGKAIL